MRVYSGYWTYDMANPFIGVRISPELNEAIAARMKQTGQSKSDVVIAALKSYLGISSSQERLEAIEQRLSALEEITGVAQSLPEGHPPIECQPRKGRKNKTRLVPKHANGAKAQNSCNNE